MQNQHPLVCCHRAEPARAERNGLPFEGGGALSSGVQASGFAAQARPQFRVLFRVALLLAVALLGSSCRTTARRLAWDVEPAVARLQAGGSVEAEVDRLVKPLVERGEVYGLVIGIITPDGATQTFRYGRSERRGESEPPAADAIFQIGSVSKLFLAALVARLVEEGQLRYDDTVRDILPPEVRVSPAAGRLTLYELVTHTAGLPREPATPGQLVAFSRYLVGGRSLYAHLNRDYLYRYLPRCRPKAREERHYAYSNFGMGLLSDLIEVTTGRPTPDLIVEKICRPLGMPDSVFALDASQQQRLAVGHTGNQACFWPRNTRMAPWDMGDILRASTGMYSSLDDLLHFAKVHLGILDHPLSPLLTSTRQVQVEAPQETLGLGWLIQRFDEGRRSVAFKHGMVAGYCGYVGVDPGTRVAVVVLSNRFDWDDKVGHNLLLRLSGGFARDATQLVRKDGG